MSGFDVRSLDDVRRRSVAVIASIVLSVVLLAALIISRLGAEPAEATEPARLAEVSAEAVEAIEIERSELEYTITSVDELRALEHAAFYTDCVACPLDTQTIVATVPSGGTLAGVLNDAGAPAGEVARAVNSLEPVFEVRRLRAGQDITVYLQTPRDAAEDEGPRLTGFSFRPDIERSITVSRLEDGSYRAREMTAEFERELVRSSGSITTSLYVDALAAGSTDRIVVELAGVLAYAVDFQRSIREGDRFDVVFERFLDSDGNVMRTGDVLYVMYAGRGEPLEYFRYEAEDGEVAYFNADGESAQRLLMMTPINGARLSSHYGMRHHPVLGYNRMHRGTDFAAPRGTPIYAAGYGVVERADRFGSFGNYVRIRHSNGFQTAYAHMQGFARGVTAGARVQQGQVIGYVGTTGRSTGPHLHYEVHHNGQSVNPMALDLPTGRTLEEGEIPLFEAERDRIIAIRDNARNAAEVGDTPASRIVSAEGTPGAQ
ncbi:peptidoglycan DD-metalloendopeptidase family protein [Hyphobacterium sp. HN65]|uniref:Peptidoglycan DD-metalloendopeptidase family protein n=1 Tax=Hyphobacterium lacteum TaxID=3116575 RepID=A0ABU7LQB7_9PROT|nr:peptidoglycan DD-metalloendopeptidase family protein [Hyphobacterium sp. HN65]MEE2526093.1 peptidoglycan DD-metalloendopeptidase family protein [Hyphobacterium sp. HN65]